jgi:hypothetical protein
VRILNQRLIKEMQMRKSKSSRRIFN